MMKFEWSNMQIVSPKALQATWDEIRATANSDTPVQKYFCDEIAKINSRIQTLINEGQRVCYANYSLPNFHTTKAKDSVEVWYASQTAREMCSTAMFVETLALARAWTELLVAKHEQTIALYQEYDANLDKFMELRGRIASYGGKLVSERPFFSVTLPVVGSLESMTYKISGNKYYLPILEQKMDELLDVIK